MSREDDVELFLTSDHVWPSTVQANLRHPFMKALKEVLLRLSDDVFDTVDSCIQFIVQDQSMLAVNVPFERELSDTINNPTFRLDTISFYRESFDYSHESLVGLLAHEIAHSFINEKEHFPNEEKTDLLIVEWGFKKELERLNEEMKKFNNE